MLTLHQATTQEKRFIGHHLLVAIIALSIGTLFGPLQAFQHAGLDIYPYIAPVIKSYYQGLSIHGVLNALVWTTFFITGFLNLTTIAGLGRSLRTPRMNKVGFWVMVVGLVTTAVPLLLDEATVLFTFYPPLKASWAFYVGLVLIVVGSWIEGWGFMATYRAWRRDNPGVRSPFVAWAGIVTVTLWQIATLGVAVEILTMLLPWSLGLIDAVDPQLARTFFWFTGHPLVYYWLLPAYISWYGMLPRQAGESCSATPSPGSPSGSSSSSPLLSGSTTSTSTRVCPWCGRPSTAPSPSGSSSRRCSPSSRSSPPSSTPPAAAGGRDFSAGFGRSPGTTLR